VRKETPWLAAIAPLLLLAIPLLAFAYIMRGAAGTVAREAENLQAKAPRVQLPEVKVPAVNLSQIKEPAAEPAVVDTTYLAKMLEIKLPDGKSLNLPETSFLNQVYKYLHDAAATQGRTFVFDGLDFDAATIKVRPETETAVTNLSTLLQSFPKATLRIEGYTDRSGDAAEDKRLSLERAETLKSLLVKAGVPTDRIKTAGLGGEKPVATNDTPEGRAKNRRIELSLDKV
jgi:outer membrane protein OmpA-like peptidoglycan-associated protein